MFIDETYSVTPDGKLASFAKIDRIFKKLTKSRICISSFKTSIVVSNWSIEVNFQNTRSFIIDDQETGPIRH